ncbi:4-(cytidine 5'-diphospho)-2-C-methyl-D-erythritol kinase [Parasphingopyxis lamellibrachiae]|uniref:4-diphosphocytidyl-2-C-methyl-D-erythritol kinase n=1 Tax=Parasphingopyxis lamellibrachiae TaxID=680125 RepID=A0A3D9FCG0_9SPHN|nr:4-(cytidine 5'-diphospho)-2-C-methyl-D-erythritol kinase [Parasphingopyxis lamellibrachiae]RED15423.1 4-diphosphocytidyl-2-C-methyl-D-erythritol kinase [Parasphingopyxis lamellibrachiae]
MKGGPGALRETAFAKINLALHVRERLPDGYHRIETLFAFCKDGDTLEAAPADDISLTIDGAFADGLSAGEDNLVIQAATQLQAASSLASGAAMRLTKALPVASGIGGGSADAAAALRLLARLWNIPRDSPVIGEIASSLGADVPACFLSETCRGDGKGDRLAPLSSDNLRECPVLLVNPGFAVPTGPVFAGWDGADRGSLALSEPLKWDPAWRNDLMDPAKTVAPAIGDVLAALEACPGAVFTRMSGSGATCFALFDTVGECDTAAETLIAEHADWWTMRSLLR